MNIYDQIDKMNKQQAKAVAKHAQARVDALDKEKREAQQMLSKAARDFSIVRFYGQDCHVVAESLTIGRFGNSEEFVYELDNGSKIVINLD